MNAAEPPGIVEAQDPTIVKQKVNVVVLEQRRVCGEHPQASGHAQMQNEGAPVESNQKVLGATSNAEDLLSLQGPGNFHRPAKRRVAYRPGCEMASGKIGFDPAPCGFDFWKFRHLNVSPFA